MSQLKEQNGRYYQECEVVMIVTKDKPFQHIYILSNEEIKEGNWFIFEDRVLQCTSRSGNGSSVWFGNSEYEAHVKYCKKIIATTDESLGKMIPYLKVGKAIKGNWKSLPKPSDSFIKEYIEEYSKGNIITKVLVEYEYIKIRVEEYSYLDIKKLKVDSNNEITIKKVKDTYTQKEVEQHILNVFRNIYPDRHWESKAWDWIKEYL